MMEDWPGVRVIRRNKRMLKDHQDAIQVGHDSMNLNGYMWKRAICDLIGAPDYYCREPGKGYLNWNFIRDGVDEMLSGPRPQGNGDAEAIERYRRNKITLIPMTMHFFEMVEKVTNLKEVDPSQRRLWLPLKAAEGTDGWISNRDSRFTVIIEEHYEHRSEWDNRRVRSLAGSVAGSYDAKAIKKATARSLIIEMLRPMTPRTLEDLTGV